MDDLLTKLRTDFDHVAILEDDHFCWLPQAKQVLYDAADVSAGAAWSLLHEVSHALLDHNNYRSDFELLKLEVAAWQKAKQLAPRYGFEIDEDHIQDCLDTYRDWLYSRSICPTCTTKSLQRDNSNEYECFNCHTSWKVSDSRFCRPYRQVVGVS